MDVQQAHAILERLASYICDSEVKITQEWIEAVSRDGRMEASSRLKVGDLERYLPALFDDLVEMLRAPTRPDSIENAGQDARLHGHERFSQGYRLDELLTELARIREMLLAHVFNFEEQTSTFRGFARRVAFQRINAFFDNMMCDSARQFTSEKDAGLRKNATNAREEKNEAQRERRSSEQRMNLIELSAKDLVPRIEAIQAMCNRLEVQTDQQTLRDIESNLAQVKKLAQTLYEQ